MLLGSPPDKYFARKACSFGGQEVTRLFMAIHLKHKFIDGGVLHLDPQTLNMATLRTSSCTRSFRLCAAAVLPSTRAEFCCVTRSI